MPVADTSARDSRVVATNNSPARSATSSTFVLRPANSSTRHPTGSRSPPTTSFTSATTSTMKKTSVARQEWRKRGPSNPRKRSSPAQAGAGRQTRMNKKQGATYRLRLRLQLKSPPECLYSQKTRENSYSPRNPRETIFRDSVLAQLVTQALHRQLVLVLRRCVGDLRLRHLQLRLGEFHDRAQAQVVAGLRQVQRQVRLVE